MQHLFRGKLDWSDFLQEQAGLAKGFAGTGQTFCGNRKISQTFCGSMLISQTFSGASGISQGSLLGV